MEHVHGDLLRADAEALVNTVNTRGVMGKGVALQFRKAFPENFRAYRRACERGEVAIGRMFVCEWLTTGNPRMIINFPTKSHWRSPSKLADIELGLEDLRRVILEHRLRSIAVPPLGCGNGGLAWRDVEPLIADALEGIDGLRLLVYPPQRAPHPSRRRVGDSRPRMTPGRAALVGLLARYVEPGFGAGKLEIQKLLYFLQEAGEPLQLQFIRGRYGPYAEGVNHVLERLEGHYRVATVIGPALGRSDSSRERSKRLRRSSRERSRRGVGSTTSHD